MGPFAPHTQASRFSSGRGGDSRREQPLSLYRGRGSGVGGALSPHWHRAQDLDRELPLGRLGPGGGPGRPAHSPSVTLQTHRGAGTSGGCPAHPLFTQPCVPCCPLAFNGLSCVRASRRRCLSGVLPVWPVDPQHHAPLSLPWLQGLLTLFAKSFASFNHSTCALSVSRRVFCLARDTPGASNCSPKPLYSGIRTASPRQPPHTGQGRG